MKIIPLGVNGAFTKYYHNNYLFFLDTRVLLVDAGTTFRYSLKDAGFKETDITDILITHLHSDHVGGLEEYAQKCHAIFHHRPNLWIRREMKQEFMEVVGKGLFNNGLTIDDYFQVHTVECGADHTFMIGNHRIELIDTNNLHLNGMKSMGLKVTAPDGMNVIFTSDVAKHEEAAFKQKIDSQTAGLFHDVSFVRVPVHSFIEDVAEYYKDVLPPERLYFMHYQDDVSLEQKQTFDGVFVESGVVYPFGE